MIIGYLCDLIASTQYALESKILYMCLDVKNRHANAH